MLRQLCDGQARLGQELGRGVLYSMPVSDVLTAVVSGVVIAGAYRQLHWKMAEKNAA